MTFKKQLTEHFKKFPASPFLFVGSGLSRRYLNTEKWIDLLKKFSDLIGENYTKINSQADGDLPKIASMLAKTYSELWWDSKIKGDKEDIYKEQLLKFDSPLKIEISDYLKNVHKQINEPFRAELELLKDCKIDGVITTNWDLLIESIFEKFSVFIGQDGLFQSRNHGVAEIYKIHGCATEPNSLVLTEGDYDEFRKKNPYLSSKLLTIFIEHPIVFIGYSLTDPHVLEILNEIVQCFPDDKLNSLRENIIFVEWDPNVTEPILTESIILKTLPVKLIRTSSYIEIFEVLSESRRRIPAHIFRLIKDELYELVITNDPKGKLYVKDSLDLENDGEFHEFVVGYGAISKVKRSEETSKQGILGIDRYDIARDIIFDNGNYDCDVVINDAFPKLLKGNVNTPIFKYLNGAGKISNTGQISEIDLCDALKASVHRNLDKYQPDGDERRRSETIQEVQIGIKELYDNCEFNLFMRMVKFVPSEKIILDDLLDILKKHAYDDFSSGERSLFIKVVCIYDLLKYSCRYKTAI
jgi:hypothetical protein